MTSWASLEREIIDTLAQADCRLARSGATRALATARERLGRQFAATRESAHRYGADQQAQMVDSLRGWLGDLREQLERNLVRGEPEARAARRRASRLRAGGTVRIKERSKRGWPGGELATVEKVVGGRRAHLLTHAGARWSISVDDTEVVDPGLGE